MAIPIIWNRNNYSQTKTNKNVGEKTEANLFIYGDDLMNICVQFENLWRFIYVGLCDFFPNLLLILVLIDIQFEMRFFRWIICENVAPSTAYHCKSG